MTIPIASDGGRARKGGTWTHHKLVYFAKYSAAFMTAMAPKRAQGKWNSLAFLDFLCGPGIDIIGAIEHRGSPLIAVATTPPFDKLFLGDRSKRNVEALRQRIAPADRDRVDLQAGDCHARAKQVVQQLPTWGALGLAFVDPEGFEVRFELFETLAQRTIDILFLFPSGIGIKRNIERFAQSDACRMDELWGNREWRTLPFVRRLAGESLSPHEAETLDHSWALAFCQRVATLGYRYYEASPPLRNDEGAPMYHLLFFSKSQAGLDIWRGISKIQPDGQRRFGW